MILFLNFAPIQFMGGAEKLALELASLTNIKEYTVLMDTSANIANIYGKFILNRTFKSHIDDHNITHQPQRFSLNYLSFLPFTNQWKYAKKQFEDARLIYMKFELAEIFISIYFGGLKSLRKTIAGFQLSLYYTSPRGLLDHIHNIIYGSFIYINLLKSVNKIHVLNERDKNLLRNKLHLKNVYLLPVGINFINFNPIKNGMDRQKLKIIFVGELSTRKGVDTIYNIIKNSPNDFIFNIVGDGPLKETIIKLSKTNNCIYHGYVHIKKLHELYNNSDVLLFPSRSESFGIVMAEAITFGLKIVNASEITLNLPINIETSIKTRKSSDYINALKNIYNEKKLNKIDKKNIRSYAIKNYSKNNIDNLFLRNILEIK